MSMKRPTAASKDLPPVFGKHRFERSLHYAVLLPSRAPERGRLIAGRARFPRLLRKDPLASPLVMLHISDSRSDIQHTLTWTNTCLTK